jgi:rubrerythrin
MDGFDLRKYQDGEEKEKISSIMGKVLSGREGYQAIIETKKVELRCPECNWLLEGGEKFCPECGHKTKPE